jgi:small subunit ribosomal protein S6
MEKKHYECMFIISADTPETKRDELIKQFTKMAGADTVVEKWGMRKFAAPINYKTQGFYVVFNFKAEPAVPNKMRDLMNITDGIVRHLFVAKDEEMLAQDVIRKQNRLRAIANRSDERSSGETSRSGTAGDSETTQSGGASNGENKQEAVNEPSAPAERKAPKIAKKQPEPKTKKEGE